MMQTADTAGRRIVAAAAGDPLSPRTFSGYSQHLFTQIRREGHDLDVVDTRDIRWHDHLRGALNVRAPIDRLRGLPSGRLRPSWYWSRRGYRTLARRFDAHLATLPDPTAPVLQVGTHLAPGTAERDLYCITDCTVVQAVRAGHFAISRSSARTIDEAVEIQRHVFASCTTVMTLSEWAARSVVEDYGVAPQHVRVVGAGANLSLDVQRRLDRQSPYVLFVGIDWWRKGGPLAVDAMRIVRRRHPTARLRIVGCRPDVHDPGVDVVGYLHRSSPDDHRRLMELYAGATCLVLLSDFDPFPNVVLEAGDIGVPVVATDVGSRREAIVPGQTGLLTAPTAGDVADAITALLDDPDLVGELGAAARRRVRERFTWPVVARRVLDEMGLAPTPPAGEAIARA